MAIKASFPAAFLLAALGPSLAHAGWYEVRNYVGTIGGQPVHVSLQTHDDLNHGQPGQWQVDGSYYYDRYRVPIILQGQRQADGHMQLCEAAEPASFGESPVVPAMSAAHPVPCPIALSVTGTGAAGEWRNHKHVLPISLRQTASLDDTGSGQPRLEGIVEIPMWHHTKKHLLLGVYQSSAECPLSMVALRLVDIASGHTDRSLTFDCGTGIIATTIYANVYRSDDPRHVTVIEPGGMHGMGEDTDVLVEK